MAAIPTAARKPTGAAVCWAAKARELLVVEAAPPAPEPELVAVTGTEVVKVLPPEVMTVCELEVMVVAEPEAEPVEKMVLEPMVLVMVEPPEVMVVTMGTVEIAVVMRPPPMPPKMVLMPMVLVMVEPPEVMVVRMGTVEMALDAAEAALDPAEARLEATLAAMLETDPLTETELVARPLVAGPGLLVAKMVVVMLPVATMLAGMPETAMPAL